MTKAKNPFMATKKEKVEGTDYTFQKVAPRAWAKLMDEWSRGGEKVEKLMDLTFEHIVVEPKVSLDDFEDWAEADEVAKAAMRFQRGK
jgi:hypothetical protein